MLFANTVAYVCIGLCSDTSVLLFIPSGGIKYLLYTEHNVLNPLFINILDHPVNTSEVAFHVRSYDI